MKINCKRTVYFVALVAIASFTGESKCAVAANNNVWSNTQLAVSALRGPIVLCGQKLNVSELLRADGLGELDKKSAAYLSSTFIRILDECVAIYNSYQNGDLVGTGEGDQCLQLAGLAFVAQDVCRVAACLCEFLGIDLKKFDKNDEDDDDCGLNDPEFLEGLSESKSQSHKKISELSRKFITYILPLAEGLAATVRAYISSYPRKNMDKRLKVLNYMCFVVINGCRIVPEILTEKSGSWGQAVAVVKATVCATLLLADATKQTMAFVDKMKHEFAETATDCKRRIATAELERNNAFGARDAALIQRDNAVKFKTVNDELQKTVSKQGGELSKTKCDNNSLIKRIDGMVTERDQLLKSIKDYEESQKQARAEIVELQNNNNRLKADNDRLTSDNTLFRNSNAGTRAKNAELRTNLNTLNDQITQKDRAIKDAEAKIVAVTGHIDRLTEVVVRQLEKDKAELTGECKRSKMFIEGLTTEIQKYMNLIEKYERLTMINDYDGLGLSRENTKTLGRNNAEDRKKTHDWLTSTEIKTITSVRSYFSRVILGINRNLPPDRGVIYKPAGSIVEFIQKSTDEDFLTQISENAQNCQVLKTVPGAVDGIVALIEKRLEALK